MWSDLDDHVVGICPDSPLELRGVLRSSMLFDTDSQKDQHFCSIDGEDNSTQMWAFCFADQGLFAKHASGSKVDAETPLITAR